MPCVARAAPLLVSRCPLPQPHLGQANGRCSWASAWRRLGNRPVCFIYPIQQTQSAMPTRRFWRRRPRAKHSVRCSDAELGDSPHLRYEARSLELGTVNWVQALWDNSMFCARFIVPTHLLGLCTSCYAGLPRNEVCSESNLACCFLFIVFYSSVKR